jgi:heme/copper-type cytochrome/quinol oxidase subunit 2
MDRKTRICIWIIVLGLVNFLAYTVVYVSLGGDAMNGAILRDGRSMLHYFLEANGQRMEVSRTVWLYSAVHSISIWLTVGAVLLSTLTLAKDHIVSQMHSSIVHGRTFMTILATVVTLITVIITAFFVLKTLRNLTNPGGM